MTKSSGKTNKYKIQEIRETFDGYADVVVSLYGRISNIRSSKNITFLDLSHQGEKIQCSFTHTQQFEINNGDLISVKGICYKTRMGEITINISELQVQNKWMADIAFKDIGKTESTPLKSFEVEAYKRTFYPYVLRKAIRSYFDNMNFIEVQTPILGKNYNGGRSFPVVSSYKENKLGYNRTTFEDRMQALIGSGFERIYQMGSVFRSENENTFLEGYVRELEWIDGKNLIKGMFASCVDALLEKGIGDTTDYIDKISKSEWIEVDLLEKVDELFGIKSDTFINNIDSVIEILFSHGVINTKTISAENAADTVANHIAQKYTVPVIIDGFPIWSSPLYKESSSGKLFRCRLYLPPLSGGFELGIQENDYNNFLSRLHEQRIRWNLDVEDERIADSDLLKIISGGLPETFGFGLSPDRILKLWDNKFNIDPYLE